MTRHDPLVPTAASSHRPMGWFAPSAAATVVMLANLIKTVAAGARTQPGRRLPDRLTTPYVVVRGGHSTSPKRKNP